MVSSFNVLGTFQRRTHQTLSKPCQGKHDHVRDEMLELERRGRGKGVGGVQTRGGRALAEGTPHLRLLPWHHLARLRHFKPPKAQATP